MKILQKKEKKFKKMKIFLNKNEEMHFCNFNEEEYGWSV